MDSLKFNKYAAGILVALLLVMGIGKLGNILYSPEQSVQEAGGTATSTTATATQASSSQSASATQAQQSFDALLAKASIKEGAQVAHQCMACHTFTKGGPNRVGPNLWGVVGGPTAHKKDFSYSSAVADLHSTWTFAKLNKWLTSPRDFAPGTKMTFPGVKDAQKRADVIAWLNQQSDNPLPLPKATAATSSSASSASTSQQSSAGASGGSAQATSAQSTFDTMLANANIKKGAQIAHQCMACHTFTKGGPNRVGPNLWGVVGGPTAHMKDYSYSSAVADLHSTWTFAKLNKWLTSPRDFAHGTKMTFPGIKNEQERADVIAWLNQQSDHPLPLPKAAAATSSGGGSASSSQQSSSSQGSATQSASAQSSSGADKVEAMIAAASPKQGAEDARVCMACHTIKKGGGARVGPPLWDVVGREVASVSGYSYSSAMKDYGGKWTLDRLFAYLQDPRGVVKGTKMTFAGIKDAHKRADLLAWLRLQSDHPVPLKGAQ